MKKLIMVLLAMAMFFAAACGGNPDSKGKDNDVAGWNITTGGKKYENPISIAGSSYYNDGKLEMVADGAQFSGTGGYYSKANGDSGAGCGGVYKTAINILDGFKIEFTVNVLGEKFTTGLTPKWDSWIGFAFVDKPMMFNSIASDPTKQFARGYVYIWKPFDVPSTDGYTGSVLVHDSTSSFNAQPNGDNPRISTVVGVKHTFELKKDEDELGVFYKMYFDGEALATGNDYSLNRINTVFANGEAYLQMYVQSWNANPNANDSEADMEYKLNKFTVHSISYGTEKISFGS